MRAALDYLVDQPREMWTRPKAHKMRPENDGFRDYFEVRYKACQVPQRPIGYFFIDDDEFTFLIWAIEKGDKFVPSEWWKTCQNRREDLRIGPTTHRDIFKYQEE